MMYVIVKECPRCGKMYRFPNDVPWANELWDGGTWMCTRCGVGYRQSGYIEAPP